MDPTQSSAVEELALKAVDSRPISAAGLSTLLSVPEPEALELVNDLAKRGLVKTLLSMRNHAVLSSASGGGGVGVRGDDPLALTFRGYLRVHPVLRKAT